MLSTNPACFRKIIFSLFIVSLLSACYYDNVQEIHPTEGLLKNCDTTGAISYSGDIVPILNSNCGTTNACHGPVNTSGYNLSTYNGLAEQAMNGDLVLAITHDPSLTPSQWMPSNCGECFLNRCSIEKITAWVNRGFPNN